MMKISVKDFCENWKYTDISLSCGFRSKGDKLQIDKMECVNAEFGTVKWDSKPESDKKIICDTDYHSCLASW